MDSQIDVANSPYVTGRAETFRNTVLNFTQFLHQVEGRQF